MAMERKFLEGGQDISTAEGYEGDLESAIAASRQRAEAKSVKELQMELDAVRLRLLRRSQIIDAIRKAYVRDVVMVKNELMRKSTVTEEEYFAQGGPGTDITDAVPSLDMRPILALFSPDDSFLRVESCNACGGHLEIVSRETKRVAQLVKRISALAEQQEKGNQETMKMRAELTLTRHRAKELEDRNIINRDTLVAKLEQTQRRCAEEMAVLKEKANLAESSWRAKLARKDHDMEMLPMLRREVKLTHNKLAEEKTAREEDLYQRDGEITTLKAKVKKMEFSADASAGVLLRAQNECDDLKRHLNAEKAEHTAIKELFDEEQSRYDRCRRSLETTRERLADLRVRHSELRAEVEAADEAAQGEAEEANDALAAARLEIERLRGLLGTSNTERSPAEPTRHSGFDKHDGDDDKALETTDQSNHEKKEPPKKWGALERFRKVVDTQIAEMSRLRRLQHEAQEPADRDRLESELDAATDWNDLDSMEDAMHAEVSVLMKQGAPGSAEKAAEEMEIANETIRKLEAEAAENREKLKRLERLEKSEKGHSVMTEELKKMEDETGLTRGFEASREFDSKEGDLSREDEAELIAELEKAKEEIKSMKMRQAMVTHELLGKIKGTTAEVEVLRSQLEQVTKERDQRVDLSNVDALQKGLLGVNEREELNDLKEETVNQKRTNAVLKSKLHERTEALKKLLESVSEAYKKTRRAKAKVWNERDLERARSIPPSTALSSGRKKRKPSVVPTEKPTIAVITSEKRPSSAAAGRSPQQSVTGGKAGDIFPEASGPRSSGGERGDETNQEAALEKRRTERAAQSLAKNLEKEEDEQELIELGKACALQENDGIEFAAERLEAVQTDVKEQFKRVFVELKDALEMHKKYVLRSRVEGRDMVTRNATLETENANLLAALESAEESLQGTRTALHETEVILRTEKEAVVELQRALQEAQKEARDHLYFKDKNASLQKKMDQTEISSRRAKQEATKAKRELQGQEEHLADLRGRVKEFAENEEDFHQREREFQVRYETLEKKLRDAEEKLNIQKTSCATQVNGCGDPELGFGRLGSTQTSFHCPELTLRRSNCDGILEARTPGPSALYGSRLLSPEGSYCYDRRCTRSDPMAGIVCPTVDGWAEAAAMDLYRPGTGLAASIYVLPRRVLALLDAQGYGGSTPASTRAFGNNHNLAQQRAPPQANDFGPCDAGRDPHTIVSTPATTCEVHCRVGGRVPTVDYRFESTFDSRPDYRESGAPVEPVGEHKRPKTCPHQGFYYSAAVEGNRAGSVGLSGSPTRHLHNRILLQSARDPSLCFQARGHQTHGTPPTEILHRNNNLLGCLLETLPMTTESQQQKLHVPPSERGRSNRSVKRPPNDRIGSGNNPASVRMGPSERIIDKGIRTEVPRPRVWEDRHMAAAAAAAVATGQNLARSLCGDEDGVGGWGTEERSLTSTRGGVAVDARLAGFRKTLKRDVFDVVERARLPMLQ